MPSIAFALNLTPDASTQLPPALLQFGRLPGIPIHTGILKDSPEFYSERNLIPDIIENLTTYLKIADFNKKQYFKKAATKYNNKIKPQDGHLTVGSFCYMYTPFSSDNKGKIRRFTVPQTGPYLVCKIEKGRWVTLMNMSSYQILKNPIAIHRLKPCRIGLNPPTHSDIKYFYPEDQQKDEYNGQLPNLTEVLAGDLRANDAEIYVRDPDQQDIDPQPTHPRIPDQVEPLSATDSGPHPGTPANPAGGRDPDHPAGGTDQVNPEGGIQSELQATIHPAHNTRNKTPKTYYINKILARKLDNRTGQELIKILPMKAKPKDAFWVPKTCLNDKALTHLQNLSLDLIPQKGRAKNVSNLVNIPPIGCLAHWLENDMY